MGLEQSRQAFECLSEASQRRWIEWSLWMPLRQGLSEYYLATGEFEVAHREAEQVCALAAWPGERTWLSSGG